MMRKSGYEIYPRRDPYIKNVARDPWGTILSFAALHPSYDNTVLFKDSTHTILFDLGYTSLKMA